MDLQLKDKIALVTASSRGLGYAAARTLAQEGCKVAINGRDGAKVKELAEKLSKETGADVIGLGGDVSLPDVPEKLIAQTAEAFGGLDILITNTGGPTSGSIDALDETAWQKGIDLCLMAHVRLIKSALPHLRKSNSASILTVTSYSVRQPIPNLLISNSVRAATVGLTLRKDRNEVIAAPESAGVRPARETDAPSRDFIPAACSKATEFSPSFALRPAKRLPCKSQLGRDATYGDEHHFLRWRI